jgi:hypothetical protein
VPKVSKKREARSRGWAKQMRSCHVPEDEHGAGGAVRVACSPLRTSTRASRVCHAVRARRRAVRDRAWHRRCLHFSIAYLPPAPRSRTAPEAPSAPSASSCHFLSVLSFYARVSLAFVCLDSRSVSHRVPLSAAPEAASARVASRPPRLPPSGRTASVSLSSFAPAAGPALLCITRASSRTMAWLSSARSWMTAQPCTRTPPRSQTCARSRTSALPPFSLAPATPHTQPRTPHAPPLAAHLHSLWAHEHA